MLRIYELFGAKPKNGVDAEYTMPDLVTLGVITKWAISAAIALTVPPRILISNLALLIRYQHGGAARGNAVTMGEAVVPDR